MSKRIVCTTSTGCLDYYPHNKNVEIIRLKIDINNKLLDDGTEILADDFFNLINSDHTLVPKTSQPPIGTLLDYFESLAKKGYEEVIVTTISSKLSGTYNGIYQCSKMLEDVIKIVPYDTKSVCFSEGCFALAAAKMVEEGKTTDEIIAKLDHMRDNNKLIFAVDSLEYLVKNGRLSGAAGFLGKMFKIKPLLEVFEDGTIQAVEKIRTTKKALDCVCDKFLEYIDGRDYFAYVVYTGKDLREYFLNTLKEKTGVENLLETPASPVVGCHVGGQAIGIGIFFKD